METVTTDNMSRHHRAFAPMLLRGDDLLWSPTSTFLLIRIFNQDKVLSVIDLSHAIFGRLQELVLDSKAPRLRAIGAAEKI